MKSIILPTLLLFATTSAFGSDNCNGSIDGFFETVAPNTKTIALKGKYTKKSKLTGEYKSCEIVIKKDVDQLSPNWEVTKLDPTNGDGGAIWPFNHFPTSEPQSTEFDKVVAYECEGSSEGFSVDYTKRIKGDFFRKKRNILALSKNDDGSYDAKLKSTKDLTPIVCRGQISEE